MHLIAKLACQTVLLEIFIDLELQSAHLILMTVFYRLSVLNPTSLCTSLVEGRILVGGDASLDCFDLTVGQAGGCTNGTLRQVEEG